MKFKPGVLVLFTPVTIRMMEAVDECYKRRGSEAVITAGRDGKHGPKSLHYEDLALDFRIWHVSKEVLPTIMSDIRATLPKEEGWDAVLEIDHLHVERDVRRVPLRSSECTPTP